MDVLLNVDEAARRLGGLSKYTVQAWLSKGKLRKTKVGSRTMIRESEIERFLAEGNKQADFPSNKVRGEGHLYAA